MVLGKFSYNHLKNWLLVFKRNIEWRDSREKLGYFDICYFGTLVVWFLSFVPPPSLVVRQLIAPHPQSW